MPLEIDPENNKITYQSSTLNPEMKYTYEVKKEPVNNILTHMLYLEPQNNEAINDFKKNKVLGLTGGIPVDNDRMKLDIEYFKKALFNNKEQDKLQILLNDSKKGGKRRKSRRNRKSKKSKKSRKNRKKSKRRSRR